MGSNAHVTPTVDNAHAIAQRHILFCALVLNFVKKYDFFEFF